MKKNRKELEMDAEEETSIIDSLLGRRGNQQQLDLKNLVMYFLQQIGLETDMKRLYSLKLTLLSIILAVVDNNVHKNLIDGCMDVLDEKIKGISVRRDYRTMEQNPTPVYLFEYDGRKLEVDEKQFSDVHEKLDEERYHDLGRKYNKPLVSMLRILIDENFLPWESSDEMQYLEKPDLGLTEEEEKEYG